MTDEPDIAALFAPVAAASAVLGLLDEARAALAGVDDPVDAELWGSDVAGALAATSGGVAGATAALADVLVPAAEQAATGTALAVLRIFSVLGDAELRAPAAEAAGRLAKAGVPEAAWADVLGDPAPGPCWHYADVGGRQESATMTFRYGAREHAISVLIDHTKGGKLKDAWVTKGPDQLIVAELAVGSDPLVVFEPLDQADAVARIRQALSAGEAPERSDQADDITAHRALIRARLSREP